MARVLLAGESWSTTTIHVKGFDTFTTSSYGEGAADFIRALEGSGHTVTFQPNHVAAEQFPSTREELDAYDVVVLSDIGANTLLLPDRVFSHGKTMPNRLDVLADWVRDGGALLMVGGYLSFQGIEAKANYRNTALADVLPVIMEIGDDREETPQGARPRRTHVHEVTANLPEEWPAILGYHRVTAHETATTVAEVGDHPLIVIDTAGKGKAAAFMTDMGPHWLPHEFLEWEGFAPMWHNLVSWLATETA
ncbi:glutamine amidotransferase [Microbacterium sp. YY-01]|uniref:glutamine amidotransferase n=1 Tax=Microbacterium sp. YY-01 TaxID=3421634 RepID=UPI003D174560